MRERHRPAPQLSLDQREIEMAEPRATHLFGKVTGIKPKLDRLGLDRLGDLARYRPRLLDLGFMGIDLVFDKRPHRRDDHLLLVRQSELHPRVLPNPPRAE